MDRGNSSRDEGGDMELGTRTLKQIYCVCDCFLSCTTLSLLLALVFLVSLHLLFNSYIIHICRFFSFNKEGN